MGGCGRFQKDPDTGGAARETASCGGAVYFRPVSISQRVIFRVRSTLFAPSSPQVSRNLIRSAKTSKSQPLCRTSHSSPLHPNQRGSQKGRQRTSQGRNRPRPRNPQNPQNPRKFRKFRKFRKSPPLRPSRKVRGALENQQRRARHSGDPRHLRRSRWGSFLGQGRFWNRRGRVRLKQLLKLFKLLMRPPAPPPLKARRPMRRWLCLRMRTGWPRK